MFIARLAHRARAELRSLWPETFTIRGVPIRFRVIEGDSGDQLRAGYESEVLDFIDSLPPGSALYDLGASIGHFSLYAASRGLSVYAFEPDPANYRAFTANARANQLDNLSAFDVAISDGSQETSVLRSNSSKQRIGDHHKILEIADFSAHESLRANLDLAVTVRSMSLDAAIGALKLPRPTALKVDIDGSEVVFVHGATRTLHDDRLKSVFIELDKGSAQYPTVVAALEAAGLQMTAEHQVSSSIGVEEGLFNIRFDRS